MISGGRLFVGFGLLVLFSSCGVKAPPVAASGETYRDAENPLRALLVPFAAKSRKEPGCHEYVLMEVESEPGRFQTYERWTGHAALDAHMKTPAMAALGPKLAPLLAKPFTQTFLTKPKAA